MRIEVLIVAGGLDNPALAFNYVDVIQPEGSSGDDAYLLDVASALQNALEQGRTSIARQAERIGGNLDR